MAIKSEPKKKLTEFVRKAALDEDWAFVIKGDKNDADNFVHRMRVELSRYRGKIKDRGRNPLQFKIFFRACEELQDGTVRITLRRSMNSSCAVHNEIDELFNDLAGGELIK